MYSLISRRLLQTVGTRQQSLNVPVFQRSMSVMRIMTPDDHEEDDSKEARNGDVPSQQEVETQWRDTLENMACDPHYGLRKEALKRTKWRQMKADASEYRRVRAKVKDLVELIKYERAMTPGKQQ